MQTKRQSNTTQPMTNIMQAHEITVLCCREFYTNLRVFYVPVYPTRAANEFTI